MVPEGWKRQPLEQLAEVRSGVAKGKTELKDPVTVPYLRVANVQDGHIKLDEVKEIEIERDKLERFSLQKGDVLMNEGGDFDKLGRGDVWLGQIEPCLHQNHVFAVRPDQQIIDSFFLAALAASNYGKTYFLSCAKRSTNLASINSTQIKEFPVLVPPLSEQKKIAQILSTWDKAIFTTDQLLANSQQQKKALMQQLLTGKKRLLDKNGVRFSGEWEKTTLESHTNLLSGFAFKSSEFEKGTTYKLLRGINISQGYLRWSKEQTFTWSDSSDYLRYELEVSDIVISMDGSLVGRNYAMISEDNIEPMLLVQRVARLRCRESLVPHFLFQHIASDRFKLYVDAVKTITAIPHISAKDIRCFPIHLPPHEEQQKISTVLSYADQEITALQQKLDALKQEKRALMQQLLTGKRRVRAGRLTQCPP